MIIGVSSDRCVVDPKLTLLFSFAVSYLPYYRILRTSSQRFNVAISVVTHFRYDTISVMIFQQLVKISSRHEIFLFFLFFESNSRVLIWSLFQLDGLGKPKADVDRGV